MSFETEKILSISNAKQLIYIVGIFAGVLLSDSVLQARLGDSNLAIELSPTNLFIKSVIAFILVPVVYQRNIDPNTPFLVQLGIYVQSGVFWPVLFDSIARIPK